MSDRLADHLAAMLAVEPLGLSCDELTSRLKRRRADVLAALRANPRFEHQGRSRGSRWRLTASDPRGRNGTGTGRNVLPWLGLDPSGIPLAGKEAESA